MHHLDATNARGRTYRIFVKQSLKQRPLVNCGAAWMEELRPNRNGGEVGDAVSNERIRACGAKCSKLTTNTEIQSPLS